MAMDDDLVLQYRLKYLGESGSIFSGVIVSRQKWERLKQFLEWNPPIGTYISEHERRGSNFLFEIEVERLWRNEKWISISRTVFDFEAYSMVLDILFDLPLRETRAYDIVKRTNWYSKYYTMTRRWR